MLSNFITRLKKRKEKNRYVDFTSLYLFLNKYKEYPVGHPQIITKDFQDLRQYFEVAKIKVLPPRGLYLLVLPYKSNGKLKLPQCRTCAYFENQSVCQCSDDERVLVGTLCIPDILKAIEKYVS